MEFLLQLCVFYDKVIAEYCLKASNKAKKV